MKNLINILLLVVLFPSIVFAHDFEMDGIYYYINSNSNEVTVTYKGTSSYQYSNEYSGSVTIPTSVTYNGITYIVTAIGSEAFDGCSSVTNITIPNSVTSIGQFAFYGTAWYDNQPDGLIYAGLVAYKYKGTMPSGTNIVIRDGTLGIAGGAFYNCKNLTKVIIPNSVISINSGAFEDCTGLNSLTLGNSITTIGWNAFSGCSALISVNIPNSVKVIDNYAFSDCSALTNLTIGNSVTTIGGCAFWYCPNLKNVIIPNSVNTIEYGAFLGCNGLTSISIPSSVTSIGDDAFRDCEGLLSVNLHNSLISNGMFHGCISLKNVSIPNTVTTIGNLAFYNCSSLASITIPNSVRSIGEKAFSRCSALASITIPNSVTSIGEETFSECINLTSMTMLNSVISNSMFYGCTGLSSLTIPNYVTSIGEYAFRNCTGLNSVTLLNSFIGKGMFYGCTGLISITIPNSIISISINSFSYCTSLSHVKLPKTLKSIESGAFRDCRSLKNIIIPNSVTAIGNYAFAGCTELTSISIPNSVSTIGNSAFQDCTGLKRATITSHLTAIGAYAFSYCNSLSSLTCMTKTPPVLENSNSFSTYSSTGLYVPRSGVENYKTHTNWRRFSKIYEFVGHFTAPDINVSKGKTVVIPVSMTNEASIIGFQTDIYLPEGFEFVKDDNDYVVDPSDRMARDHAIMCNVSEDGALRVLCYSPTNRTISGNEGELFYVTIKAPNDTVGEFSLWFKNTILTTSDAEELLSPDANTILNVIPYLPGDANGNGEVSVIDIVTAAQYIIFQNPNPFLFEASDLNNDEQITVTDLALIANLILYPTMNAPKRVPSVDLSEDQIHGNDIHLNAGETRTVNITLDNVEKYSAFQMDLKLPDGLTACNFKMANQSDSHSFITSEEKDGSVRVLCYSPSLTALGNDNKSFLTFDVTSTSNIVGNIMIDGIELVTTLCQPIHFGALAIGVNQTNTVNEVSNGKIVAHIDYYNLAGQKQAEPAKGVTIIVTSYTDGSRSTQKVIM